MRKRIIFFIILICLLITAGSCRPKRNTLIVGQIKDAAELATVEITLKKFVLAKKDRKIFWFIPLKEAYFIAETEAVIKAGIDLDQIEPGDINIKGKRIEIKLPPPVIINFSYPAEKFKIIDKSNFKYKKITIADMESFYGQAEMDIRKNMDYLGIKKECLDKFRSLMDVYLKTYGYEEIYISYRNEREKISEDKKNLNLSDEEKPIE